MSTSKNTLGDSPRAKKVVGSQAVQKLDRRAVLKAAAAVGAVWTFPQRAARAMVNDEVRVGFVSCGGRAGEHMSAMREMPGVSIAALCDVDGERMDTASRNFPKAKTASDLRRLLDDPDIDAVFVVTSNHWHCLASIWAMEAGKHVYVEKPLSHTQWEGDQTVKAARKYNRVCQVGTQQRSDPMQAEIKKFLHEDKALGKIQSCRVNRYGVRASIGKRATPLQIDKSIDYNLWLGPAEDKPIFRDKLQYDWHWDFNTGNGEMGNWGVHIVDDVRNNVFLDKISMPNGVFALGNRVVWDDAGDTPNATLVYLDTGDVPTVISLSNLTDGPKSRKSPDVPGPSSGYVVVCEGGRFEGQRGRGAAYDKSGKLIREFRGNSGGRMHQENFIDCVRAEDASGLNADVAVGNDSTGWCNMANIGFQVGGSYSPEVASEYAKEVPMWGEMFEEFERHLASHSVKMTDMVLGAHLTFDSQKGIFTGQMAEKANTLLKRKYREGFEVPEIG